MADDKMRTLLGLAASLALSWNNVDRVAVWLEDEYAFEKLPVNGVIQIYRTRGDAIGYVFSGTELELIADESLMIESFHRKYLEMGNDE